MYEPRLIAGTYMDGRERVRVELRASIRPAQQLAHGLTTAHEPIPADAVELSISADLYAANLDGSRDKRHNDMIGGGQSLDALRAVIDGGHARTTRDTLRVVLDAWERYHLNGMQSACDHQPEVWTCTRDANAETRETVRRIGGDPDSIPADVCNTRNGWPVVRELGLAWPKRGDECITCERRRWDEPSDWCPVSGYHYGSAWLFKAVPADVLEAVRRAFGMVPATV